MNLVTNTVDSVSDRATTVAPVPCRIALIGCGAISQSLHLPVLAGHEGIRLTATGVALATPMSLLPDLRSSKEEGQANFVNPGIYVFNLGADFEVTPKLRAFVNSNYLRFDRTEPLELLLFQRPIRHSIGTDVGAGFEYRPPLSENIVVRGGASALVPGQSLEDIYNGRVLFSLFANVKFQF